MDDVEGGRVSAEANRYLALRSVTTLGTERAKALQLVPPETLPTPAELVREQVQAAVDRTGEDYSGAPRWPWRVVDDLMGPMLPGDFVVVGALTGNGKSSFLMSAMDQWAERKLATLYIPLEIDPALCRLRWAAWKLGLDPVLVFRNEWDALPATAKADVAATLRAQQRSPFIHFAPPRRISLTGIVKWTRWAVEAVGVRQVILDHFHRMDQGGDQASHRLAVTDTARQLKDLARELGIVFVAAAQLNRSHDPLDAYVAPQVARIKESSGIAEEADSLLMLSRKLQREIDPAVMRQVRAGTVEAVTIAERNTMAITCRKHRLDDAARDGQVYLGVSNGRVMTRYGVEP